MIKEVNLKDWKSFSDSILYIDPLTLIIGANASGKSNTLDALLFLKRISSGIPIIQSINGDINIPSIRGGIEWVCRKPACHFTLEIIVEENNIDYRYRLSVKVDDTTAEVFQEELTQLGNIQKTVSKEKPLYFTKEEETTGSGIPTYFYTAKKGRKRCIDLNRSYAIISQIETMNIRKEIKEGARAVLSNLQKIFVFDPIPNHMRNYSSFSDHLKTDGSNIAGVLAALPEPRKKEVEKTLTDYLKDLPEKDIIKVWTETVGKFKTDAMLYCKEGWVNKDKSQIVDSRGMSDGTLRYLAIVTAMLTQSPGSLIVVEEVDNGLHPSRAYLLINMLRKIGKDRSVDVIVTTHNPAMLDAAGSKMIPFIIVAHRDKKTGASKLTQLEDIQQLPKLMAFGSLGRLTTEGRIEDALNRED